MTVLSRADSSSVTYTNQELATIITGLEISNNQHQVASDVVYIRTGTNRLLILDVGALHNRRLLETYAIHYDGANTYNLKFTASNVDFNLDSALDAVGFSNLTPVASLASIFAAQYAVTANQQYLESTNLVKTQGTLGTAPAELKNLVAGNGCTLATTDNEVKLDVTGITIVYPPPVYGSSSLTTSTLAETTFWGGSNHALVFTAPLFGVQTDLGAGTIDGQAYAPARVTHLAINQAALDAETNVLIGNSLGSYSTTAQVQAMITAAQQAILDGILVGSASLVIDRSIPAQITLNLASTLVWSTGTATFTLDGSQDANQEFNINTTTMVGARVSDAGIMTGTSSFTLTMAYMATSNGGYEVLVRENQGDHGFIRHFLYPTPVRYTYLGERDGGPGVLQGGQTWNPNVWYHFALRWDGTTGQSFLNGVPQAVTNQPNNVNMTSPLYLGLYSNNAGKMPGQLKYGRYFSSAKSDGEILALSNEALS